LAQDSLVHDPAKLKGRHAIGALDWLKIAAFCARRHRFVPTRVIVLRRDVSLAESGQLAEPLAEVQLLAEQIDSYRAYHAARPDMAAPPVLRHPRPTEFSCNQGWPHRAKKKAELPLGQVQQGGMKEREHAHRCFESADRDGCCRKQGRNARKFGIADMQLLHGSNSPPAQAAASSCWRRRKAMISSVTKSRKAATRFEWRNSSG
jgi:hypothetical protein